MPTWSDASSRFLGRSLAAAACFLGAFAAGGCDTSSSNSNLAGFDRDSPHITQALFVDVDGNGSDEDDVIVLTFDRGVVVQGNSIAGLTTRSGSDTFGDGASLRQSVAGSDRVEVILGEDASLSPGPSTLAGATRVNIARAGSGPIQVADAADPETLARPTGNDVPLEDATASAPEIVEARVVDADADGLLGAGDLIVASFNKPISVPAGATVAQNFVLPVTGDSFGAAPVLAPASSGAGNRAVTITLGAAAILTAAGTFAPGSTGAGSPSGLEVAALPTITDTLESSPIPLAPGIVVDLVTAEPTLFGNGREAQGVIGTSDGFTPRLTAQGLQAPAGIDAFSGTFALEGEVITTSLLFVVDRGNDRLLIFNPFPSGNFASASWVLGQPDASSAASDDPSDPASSGPGASTLRSPSDVAWDPSTNTLFVSDTGNHRVLVWEDLFTLDDDTGSLFLENGRPASFALGQTSLVEGRANRGQGGPSAGSLSLPTGLSVSSGRLAIADTGNSRILIHGSIPGGPGALPGTVLGQADFGSGAANRGGAAGAGTLSAPKDVFFSPDLVVNGSTGGLVVVDTDNNRVLLFETFSPATGADADVVIGQANFTAVGAGTSATTLRSPSSVIASPGPSQLYVADTGNHRVMTYSLAGAIANGAAGAAIGQLLVTGGLPNRGGAPGAETLSLPDGLAIDGTALVVSDTGNHRVLVYEGASLPTTHRDATKVIGQSSFSSVTPAGRRFNQPTDTLLVKGKLIISDTGNHRILIYDSPPLSGDPDPDVVLGQADLFSTLPNRGGAATADTLRLPTYLATDGTRLVAADTGNHRVLIWSAIPAVDGTPADVILGQSSAAGALPNAGGPPSASVLNSPEGLAVTPGEQLVVADRENHRILIFEGFSLLMGFEAASTVLGQRRFDRNEANRGGAVGGDTLNRPRDVLFGAGRLYAADSGNHRVLVWRGVPRSPGRTADGVFGQSGFLGATSGGAAPQSLREPAGLAMDPDGEFLLVSDTANDRVVFFGDVTGEDPARREARGVLGQTNLFAGMDPRLSGTTFATLENPRGIFFNGYELLAADSGQSRLAVFR
ncbi:MAG TPA: NHL repeat-containing protein [Planctomycetota bacterium]|nr:NHL repeat-containing protein [Planctomycetota bacterium]